MIITIDTEQFIKALKIEGTDEYREAFISVGEFQKALKIAEVKQSGWISVEERLPTVEEDERGLIGFVNGYNGKIRFTEAIIFVDYDFNEKEWWSQDYDLTGCKVEYWMPIPEAPKTEGEGR